MCWSTVFENVIFCIYFSADYMFAPSQWDMALLCNGVSHWLGINLESALYVNNGGNTLQTIPIWSEILEQHALYVCVSQDIMLKCYIILGCLTRRFSHYINYQLYQPNDWSDFYMISHWNAAYIIIIWKGQCKIKITPLLTHWSLFLQETHQYMGLSYKKTQSMYQLYQWYHITSFLCTF